MGYINDVMMKDEKHEVLRRLLNDKHCLEGVLGDFCYHYNTVAIVKECMSGNIEATHHTAHFSISLGDVQNKIKEKAIEIMEEEVKIINAKLSRLIRS